MYPTKSEDVLGSRRTQANLNVLTKVGLWRGLLGVGLCGSLIGLLSGFGGKCASLHGVDASGHIID